jgi:hypothetical protein
MQVHPLFDLEQQVWVAESGVVAKTLRELQQKLPGAEIIGYYPNGYQETGRQTWPLVEGRFFLRSNYRSSKKVQKRRILHEKRLTQEKAELERIEGELAQESKQVAPLHTNGHTGGWLPEQDSLIRRGAAQGWSAAQVAGLTNRTRAAVLGRAHRLGISFR